MHSVHDRITDRYCGYTKRRFQPNTANAHEKDAELEKKLEEAKKILVVPKGSQVGTMIGVGR